MRTVAQPPPCGLLLAIITLAWVTGCGTDGRDVPVANIPTTVASRSDARSAALQGDLEPYALAPYAQEFQSPARALADLRPEVVIRTSLGSMRVRLDAGKSPRTVDNFLYNYVDSGFYAQTIFHYVERGYLIAAGGYTADLQEKPVGPPIPCEADNGLSNKRGTVAMARQPDYAPSATSQFFINLVDNPSLDYQPSQDGSINGYCVFGEVIEGMDTVDRIAETAVHDQGEFIKTPIEPVIIESITRVE